MSDWRIAWTAWKGSAHRKLTGHHGDVTSVAIGKVAGQDVIVSASHDGTVRIWDGATGGLIGEPLETRAGLVSAMVLGQVGERDVIACAYGRAGFKELRVWDAVTRRPTGPPFPGHGQYVDTMVLGRSGGRDVIAWADRGDHTVRIWDAGTAQPIGPPAALSRGWHWALALAEADGRDVLAVAVGESTVLEREGPRVGHGATFLLDPGTAHVTGSPVLIHDGGIQSAMAMTYEPERDVVLCAGQTDDQTIGIWDARTGQAIGRPLNAPGVHALTFGRIAGRLILVSSHYNEATRFWDAFTGAQVRYPMSHDYSPQVLSMGRVADRDVIVCGCRDYLEVVDWDAKDHPFGHTDSVRSLACGTFLGSGIVMSGAACDDDRVLVWEATTGEPLGAGLKPHHVSVDGLAAGRAGDRDVVITADQNSSRTAGQIRVWRPISDAQVGDPIPCGGYVAALAMGRAGDRDLIVSAATDGVVTWDAVTREAVHRLPFPSQGQPRALTLVANGPDLTILCAVVSYGDVNIYGWDAATGQALKRTIIIANAAVRSALAFGQVGNRPCIVCVDEHNPRQVWLHDASDVDLPGQSFVYPNADIYALAAGCAGGRDVVVAGTADGAVVIWDAATGEQIGEPLTGHDRRPVWAVTLAHVEGPDYPWSGVRDFVLSGGDDQRVICWTDWADGRDGAAG
ncbi:MAG TPA: hypothetical protein VME19_13885 [Streptosporangiaceae bacterium]|nr:hypothetical protein [Streptosporangiaceae bacterium]